MTDYSIPNTTSNNSSISVLNLCIAALFMAITVMLSSFGLPVPGGHLYLNDIAIVTASLLLDPFSAFLVGGIGSFLGDFLFYPAPMFVSLVTHGLQAVIISIIAHKNNRISLGILGSTIGAIIMIIGYTLGRAFIYSTPAYAIMKLPFQILQAAVGVVIGLLLVYKFGIKRLYNHFRK
jgi:uncharacterized membrane protein